jgi:hypothetical protein
MCYGDRVARCCKYSKLRRLPVANNMGKGLQKNVMSFFANSTSSRYRVTQIFVVKSAES